MKKTLLLTLPLLVLGLGMLHYTEAAGWEHHTAQAARFGIPAPSYAIYAGGVVLTIVASFWAGLRIGRRKAAAP